MQILIEEAIRGIGYITLKLVTLGRYKMSSDGLLEGALGLVLVGIGFYVSYRFVSA